MDLQHSGGIVGQGVYELTVSNAEVSPSWQYGDTWTWENGTLVISGTPIDISNEGWNGYLDFETNTTVEEGIDEMMDLLTDLIFGLNLSEADVATVKRIAKHGGWKDALLLYLLAESVKDGLKPEDLGFEEESE